MENDKYCQEYDIEKIHEKLNEKIKPNHAFVIILAKNYKNFGSKEKLYHILLLFKNYGYDLIDNDIIVFTRNKIDVSDIKKEISPDLVKKLEPICNELDFFVYGIKSNLLTFKKKLGIGYKNPFKHLLSMKTFIKNNDIKPDLECLQILCESRQNNNHIKYLINEFKIIPDLQCIQNSINCGSLAQVKIVFEEYKKNL